MVEKLDCDVELSYLNIVPLQELFSHLLGFLGLLENPALLFGSADYSATEKTWPRSLLFK